jgi:hypothetical protein
MLATEITLFEISMINENDKDSRARAEIKSIRMVGVGHGGATECI